MASDKPDFCVVKQLPAELQARASKLAAMINPLNAQAPDHGLLTVQPLLVLLNSKYWGSSGVTLTVGFMESTPTDLKNRILDHMNAWGDYCNVTFALSNVSPQVRITREEYGYWSYLGTDILLIPSNQATMGLFGFTMSYPESEFRRVVRHETGHTLGFHHEHLRAGLIARLDQAKTIEYFRVNYGWSAAQTIWNVLTPLEESSITGSTAEDETSIMCYYLPGIITTDGRPIAGGVDITSTDAQFANQLYPLSVAPPPPPPSAIVGEAVGNHWAWVPQPAPQYWALGLDYPSPGEENWIQIEDLRLRCESPFSVYTSFRLTEFPSYGHRFNILYRGEDEGSFETDPAANTATSLENTEVSISLEEGVLSGKCVMVVLTGYDKKTRERSYISSVSEDFEVEEDDWVSVGVTYTGKGTRTGIKIYVDGVNVTTKRTSPGTTKEIKGFSVTTNEAMKAFYSAFPNLGLGGSGFQGGEVQRLTVWSKALSAKAMLQLHEDQVKADSENLEAGVFAKFLFDEGAGDSSASDVTVVEDEGEVDVLVEVLSESPTTDMDLEIEWSMA